MKKILISLAVMAAAAVAIVAVSAENRLDDQFEANLEALAGTEYPLTGTCCPENGSICCVGQSSFANYYYKKEGSCK